MLKLKRKRHLHAAGNGLEYFFAVEYFLLLKKLSLLQYFSQLTSVTDLYLIQTFEDPTFNSFQSIYQGWKKCEKSLTFDLKYF